MRGRIVFFCYWLMCVLLFSSYTAGLTTQLAVKDIGPPFQTVEEALEREYRVAVNRGDVIIDGLNAVS